MGSEMCIRDRPDGDTSDVHALLDDVRESYVAFYDEAEAVAQSSVLAARREGRLQALEARPAGPDPFLVRARRKLRRTFGT